MPFITVSQPSATTSFSTDAPSDDALSSSAVTPDPSSLTSLSADAPSAASSSDVELYYEDAGTGKPIVLIHGWPLSSRSFEKQVPELLDAGYRVISYDRRGFGKSSQATTGFDYDTLASDLNALITTLDLKDATLLGFSMGGGEVARYLAVYGSDRVEKAVFAAAVPPYLFKTEGNADGALDDDAIAEFETGITTDRIAFIEEFLGKFYSTSTTLTGAPKLLVSGPQKAYDVAQASLASPIATLKCVSSFARTDFRADLAAITVPTLVIHGSGDQVVPFEASGRRIADSVTGARLAEIADAPHGLNVTHSAEFNSALLEFLALDAGSAVVRGEDVTDASVTETSSAPITA